jgi:hypothetical protein
MSSSRTAAAQGAVSASVSGQNKPSKYLVAIRGPAGQVRRSFAMAQKWVCFAKTTDGPGLGYKAQPKTPREIVALQQPATRDFHARLNRLIQRASCYQASTDSQIVSLNIHLRCQSMAGGLYSNARVPPPTIGRMPQMCEPSSASSVDSLIVIKPRATV